MDVQGQEVEHLLQPGHHLLKGGPLVGMVRPAVLNQRPQLLRSAQ